MTQKYEFKATGVCQPDTLNPKGIKIRCAGDVSGPPGYPMSVFEAAKKCVLAMFPGVTLTPQRHQLNEGEIFPTLRAVGKPK